MATILALDTSGAYCSVAIIAQGSQTSPACRYALHEVTPRSHVQRLLPMMKEIMDHVGLSMSELDMVAYGRGPGSFTGVRIAAGVAQGLALGLDVPLLAISTLQTLALESYKLSEVATAKQALPQQQAKTPMQHLVCLDARMGEVYTGCFAVDLATKNPITVVHAETVCAPTLVPVPSTTFTLCGSGMAVDGLPASLLQNAERSWQDMEPRAEYMAELALAQYARGEYGAIEEALPVYLRDEVTWQKLPRFQS